MGDGVQYAVVVLILEFLKGLILFRFTIELVAQRQEKITCAPITTSITMMMMITTMLCVF